MATAGDPENAGKGWARAPREEILRRVWTAYTEAHSSIDAALEFVRCGITLPLDGSRDQELASVCKLRARPIDRGGYTRAPLAARVVHPVYTHLRARNIISSLKSAGQNTGMAEWRDRFLRIRTGRASSPRDLLNSLETYRMGDSEGPGDDAQEEMAPLGAVDLAPSSFLALYTAFRCDIRRKWRRCHFSILRTGRAASLI